MNLRHFRTMPKHVSFVTVQFRLVMFVIDLCTDKALVNA
jgi:hypothetical protein